MKKRPRSVAAIGYLFVATGIVGLVHHASEFDAREPVDYELVWTLLVRLLAIVCGVFMLRGANWARWAALAWLAYHVVLSAWHTLPELVTHGLLLAVLGYFLLREQASVYFRGPKRTV